MAPAPAARLGRWKMPTSWKPSACRRSWRQQPLALLLGAQPGTGTAEQRADPVAVQAVAREHDSMASWPQIRCRRCKLNNRPLVLSPRLVSRCATPRACAARLEFHAAARSSRRRGEDVSARQPRRNGRPGPAGPTTCAGILAIRTINRRAGDEPGYSLPDGAPRHPGAAAKVRDFTPSWVFAITAESAFMEDARRWAASVIATCQPPPETARKFSIPLASPAEPLPARTRTSSSAPPIDGTWSIPAATPGAVGAQCHRARAWAVAQSAKQQASMSGSSRSRFDETRRTRAERASSSFRMIYGQLNSRSRWWTGTTLLRRHVSRC